MSSLIVEVCLINKILPHENADALEIAEVKGWHCIVKKDSFKQGDKVVYFPVDTILPTEASDKFGVTKYLSNGRVRAARLRGVVSCGLVVPCDDPSWEVGKDLVEHYGATKWEPPEKHRCEDAEVDDPLFYKYTDIENIRNFPEVLRIGEEVVITEKIHGTNCRTGKINGTLMAGSHNMRRKQPENYTKGLYWLPFADLALHNVLAENPSNIIAYSEVFGDGVQDLKYQLTHGKKAYRVFDLMIDGEYVDHDTFMQITEQYKVPTVPILYRGSWDPKLLQLAEEDSVVAPSDIREGIVIKPVKERWDQSVGRVILKCVSNRYILRRGGTETH